MENKRRPDNCSLNSDVSLTNRTGVSASMLDVADPPLRRASGDKNPASFEAFIGVSKGFCAGMRKMVLPSGVARIVKITLSPCAGDSKALNFRFLLGAAGVSSTRVRFSVADESFARLSRGGCSKLLSTKAGALVGDLIGLSGCVFKISLRQKCV